jgi:anti-sigma factor RsiW
MTCSETRDLLSAWLDQALDDHEREQVEAHLGDCPECRRELEGLRSTVSLLSRVEPCSGSRGIRGPGDGQGQSRAVVPEARKAGLSAPLRQLPLEAGGHGR